jgi:hypothetical protein
LPSDVYSLRSVRKAIGHVLQLQIISAIISSYAKINSDNPKQTSGICYKISRHPVSVAKLPDIRYVSKLPDIGYLLQNFQIADICYKTSRRPVYVTKLPDIRCLTKPPDIRYLLQNFHISLMHVHSVSIQQIETVTANFIGAGFISSSGITKG